MMDRLTERHERHVSVVCDHCVRRGGCCNSEDCAVILRDRLAAYEDTNLSPSEVASLQQRLDTAEKEVERLGYYRKGWKPKYARGGDAAEVDA